MSGTPGLVHLELKTGRVTIELLPELAPNHVQRIKELVQEHFYDGLAFHRVLPGFMAQTGDPTGTGGGKSGKPNLKAEFSKVPHRRGGRPTVRAHDPQFAFNP